MAVRVLVVDDSVVVRVALRDALAQRGGIAVVAEAETAAEAIDCAEQHRPDVVMLDLGLPDLAGREVLTRIRDVAPSARVVVFSGHETVREPIAATVPTGAWGAHDAEHTAPAGASPAYLADLVTRLVDSSSRVVRSHFGHDPASVPAARRFVQDHLRSWDVGHLRQDASLVVTELAANALDHAESDFEVRLALTGVTLRLEVLDSGPGMPDPQPAEFDSERGRGLVLVGSMAASWGVDDISDDGKIVWAELPLRPTG